MELQTGSSRTRATTRTFIVLFVCILADALYVPSSYNSPRLSPFARHFLHLDGEAWSGGYSGSTKLQLSSTDASADSSKSGESVNQLKDSAASSGGQPPVQQWRERKPYLGKKPPLQRTGRGGYRNNNYQPRPRPDGSTDNGFRDRPQMQGTKFYMEKLVSATDEKDARKFVKSLKSLAMEQNNAHCVPKLVPMLDAIVIKDLDGSLTADLIWSLGRLNFAVTQSEQKPLLMNLMGRFCELDDLTSREVTTSLVGFSKLRFRWSYLSTEMQEDIVLAVGGVSDTLNDREVGNLLHSFSKLGVPWTAFPRSHQNGLLEAVVRVSKRLVSQQGSMAIYSLGLMGVVLDDVTPAVRDHIFVISLAVLEESKVHVDQSVTQQVSNVIYGLAKMGAKYKQLPMHVVTGVKEGIIHAMGSMNEQEVANSIYSLGIMGTSWSELPLESRDVLCRTIVERFPQMIPQGMRMRVGCGCGCGCRRSSVLTDSRSLFLCMTV